MAEPDRGDMPDAPLDAPPDVSTMIAALRTAGGHRFDPVRLHYIEVLAKRATAHEGPVRRLLDSRLAQALAALTDRLENARRDAREVLVRTVAQHPHAAGDLQRLFLASDFDGLGRSVAALKVTGPHATLGALVRQLGQHSPDRADALAEENAGAPTELKTIRNFRNTRSKLSADKQVAQALGQPPKNAGPINSHMLVLRSLALMREVSPDYLNRFMSYADTLLCLDECEKEKRDSMKKPAKTRSAKR